MFNPFTSEDIVELSPENGLVIRCTCTQLISLSGYAESVPSPRACYAALCKCGRAYRTEVLMYKPDILGQMRRVREDYVLGRDITALAKGSKHVNNGDGPEDDGNGDTPKVGGTAEDGGV